jgi:quinol-cytochrome oxidoreductase complex cytochrome b subunit
VLATTLPATMGPKANPLETPEVIKPEWYFYVAFRWLKLFSGTFAVLSMGFVVFIMFLWPFIDAAIRRVRKGSELSVWIGIAGVASILGLTIWEAAVAH